MHRGADAVGGTRSLGARLKLGMPGVVCHPACVLRVLALMVVALALVIHHAGPPSAAPAASVAPAAHHEGGCAECDPGHHDPGAGMATCLAILAALGVAARAGGWMARLRGRLAVARRARARRPAAHARARGPSPPRATFLSAVMRC